MVELPHTASRRDLVSGDKPLKRKGRPIGQTLGGMIVGFDQQIFRTLPPPNELVLKAAPVRGLTGQDGTGLEVVFPEDEAPPEADRS